MIVAQTVPTGQIDRSSIAALQLENARLRAENVHLRHRAEQAEQKKREVTELVIQVTQSKGMDANTKVAFLGLHALRIDDPSAPAYGQFRNMTDRCLAGLFGISENTANTIVQKLEGVELARRKVESRQDARGNYTSTSTLFLFPAPEILPFMQPTKSELRAREREAQKRATTAKALKELEHLKRMACPQCGTIGEWQCANCGFTPPTEAQTLGTMDTNTEAQTLVSGEVVTEACIIAAMKQERTGDQLDLFTSERPAQPEQSDVPTVVCEAVRVDVCPIPPEIAGVSQWVGWRYEPNPSNPDKPKKAPMNPRTGAKAMPNDSSTWTLLEQAQIAAQRHQWDGIGFMFGEQPQGFIGVDLDDCLDEHGTPTLWARCILSELDSYAEVSPSGRGVKIFLRGTIDQPNRKDGDVELYHSARFFTFTGRHVVGTPVHLEERSTQVKAFYQRQFPEKVIAKTAPQPVGEFTHADDATVIEKALKARNGTKFESLFFRGVLDTKTPSQLDCVLCNMLAYWTDCDPSQMDRLFRASALYRPEKWDTKHSADGQTYGQMTIADSIAYTRRIR